jgi:RNA polymerase sigma-70 factor (ECF subfamily)
MTSDGSFDELMHRLRAGDEAAAAQLFHRFAHRLIGLARSRLDPLIRGKMDPEEVVQSVYKSFFLQLAEGRLELAGWDSLWAVLTVLTVRKCGHRIDYYHAARRDVRGEVAPPRRDELSGTSWEAIARDPTPVEAAMLAELVEQLMAVLDERDQEIVRLALQGQPAAEISAAAGCSERTVKRVLDRVRAWLERRQANAARDG